MIKILLRKCGLKTKNRKNPPALKAMGQEFQGLVMNQSMTSGNPFINLTFIECCHMPGIVLGAGGK